MNESGVGQNLTRQIGSIAQMCQKWFFDGRFIRIAKNQMLGILRPKNLSPLSCVFIPGGGGSMNRRLVSQRERGYLWEVYNRPIAP